MNEPRLVERGNFRIGLIVPRSGSAGIYGPSCRACAELAVEEVNRSGGIDGRTVALTLIDGSQNPMQVAQLVRTMLDAGMLDALIGMHESDVRKAVLQEVSGRIPYIYTANYEGNETADFVISIGLTTYQQTLHSVSWLKEHRQVNQWSLIGNDYSWPRQVAEDLRKIVQTADCTLSGVQYVPLGSTDFTRCLKSLFEAGSDAVFVALVGADAVHFNRQFVQAGFDKTMLRFLPLLEENTLIAAGPNAATGVFTAGIYFADMDSPENADFLKRYEAFAGTTAPQLNAFAISCYEGVQLLKTIFEAVESRDAAAMVSAFEGRAFQSLQGPTVINGRHSVRDVLLAEASEDGFSVRARFSSVYASPNPQRKQSQTT